MNELMNEIKYKSSGSCRHTFIIVTRAVIQGLNMVLDFQSLFGLHVHSCTHWLRPQTPPPPTFGLKNEGAIGQPIKTTSLCDPPAVIS
jgi:hypothetical protein